MTSFKAFYQQAATVANYPNPNGLTVINPLNANPQGGADLSPAWLAQGKKLILATSDATSRNLRLGFNPSGGNTITFTVQLWIWNLIEQKWCKLGAPYSGTGDDSSDVVDVGNDLVYIQLVSIASGTLDISFVNAGYQVY